MVVQLLRMVGSLAVVLVVMWGVARVLRPGGRRRNVTALEVISRQQLSRGSSVALVRVGDRALVLGVGEGRVSLLAETDLAAVTAPALAPVTSLAGVTRAPATLAADVLTPDALTPGALQTTGSGAAPAGPLAGSVLSPQTWRTAVEVVRERTVRRA